MKRYIVYILIFTLFNVGSLFTTYASSYEPNEKKINELILNNKNSFIENNPKLENTKNLDSSRSNRREFLTNTTRSPKTVETKEPLSYVYSPNLILNGNFELGHAYWTELYKSYNGNWYDYDFIIQSGGGYDSWSAYIGYNDWLVSNAYRTPNNVVDFEINYMYRLAHWGSCSGYGINAIGVFLIDNTSNNTYTVNVHDAETDPYDYDYKNASFFVTSSVILNTASNHDLNIEFMQFNDDPNCSLAFYLDNVSVEPIISVPDYTISTSAGSNGSVSIGNTLPQGSNYTVTITPNSSYEVSQVLVDGTDVGPVNYYTFTNITTNHTITASFSSITSSTKRIFRFWNKVNGFHFYTQNAAEMTALINDPLSDWRYENVAYRADETANAGTTPLYRFWSKTRGNHFYTMNENEKIGLVNNGSAYWKYEGIAFYVYPLGSATAPQQVYRFFNKISGQHFYTTNVDEKNGLINFGSDTWNYENVAWKVE